jgi:hypothetical protein
MSTFIDDVRACESVAELNKLYNELGGAANGPEFTQVFTWRKEELLHPKLGANLTQYASNVEAVFKDWEAANEAFVDHGKKWARADAELKKMQGKKFLYYRSQHKGAIQDAQARTDDDAEIFQLRLDRNTNEALMKTDYKIIELLAAKWDYLQSLMVTERGGTDDRHSGPRETGA